MRQNVPELLLTKPLPRLRELKVQLNMCWPNPSHYSEDTKIYLNLCWPNPSNASDDIKHVSTRVDLTHTMPARKQYPFQHVLSKHLSMPAMTQNASQHVLTKPIPTQRGNKMHLNFCWANPPHASEITKCILTCFAKTPPMTTRYQNASHHLLTNHFPMAEGTKCILPPRTQYVSQLVLTKPLPFQWREKMHINVCWQTNPMPAWTQNASLHVLTKPNPCQRKNKMHLNVCWPYPFIQASSQYAYQLL